MTRMEIVQNDFYHDNGIFYQTHFVVDFFSKDFPINFVKSMIFTSQRKFKFEMLGYFMFSLDPNLIRWKLVH